MRATLTLAQRFWAKVEKTDGCWLWRASIGSHGYGQLMVTNGRPEPSHRISWFIAHGEWPTEGLFVCHRCDNKRCVNPAHLFLGTARDNVDDAVAKGRNSRGEMVSKISAEDVIAIRNACSNGESQRSVAARIGICQAQVSRIVRRERWAHLGAA